jgi:drug/metabolite transporter (DMT)-like permease
MQIGIENEHILVVIGSLFLFGLIYATLVNRLNRKGYSEGYTAFLVVAGVLVTLTANIPLHHPNPWLDYLLTLACFAASGLPMIINDWLRHVSARKADQEYLAHTTQEGIDDGTT